MNTLRPYSQRAKWLALPALLACITAPASAQLSWDPGITSSAAGGSTSSEATEWKTPGAGNVWYDGASNVAWTNGSSATFGGTAGTVNLGSNISAGTLNFTTPGYTIDLRDWNAGSTVNGAAYALTLTGLSGSSALIRNTASGTPGSATVNLQMAADTVWTGSIGSGGERININVSGGNDLTVNQVIRSGGFSQTSLGITGAGTALILSGTGSTFGGNFVNVGAGTTFNLGANGNFSARAITLNATGTITATGTARIIDDNSNSASDLAGFLSGTLAVQQSDANNAMTISNDGNSYSGGTFVTAGSINVDANNALGTGVVQVSNTSGTSTLNFRSATPVIGSLSSSGAGTKSIVLGNTGIDTNLTVNQTAAGTFAGVISQFSGRTGSVTVDGDSILTLSGANTYTGNTTVDTGASLTLGSTGEFRFLLTNTTSNTVTGAGTVALNGLFRLDITGVSAGSGTWNLVNVGTLTESFGGTFGLAFVGGPTFTNSGGGVYTSGDWTFTQSTGNLTLVPEPTTMVLLTAGLVVITLRRRRS